MVHQLAVRLLLRRQSRNGFPATPASLLAIIIIIIFKWFSLSFLIYLIFILAGNKCWYTDLRLATLDGF